MLSYTLVQWHWTETRNCRSGKHQLLCCLIRSVISATFDQETIFWISFQISQCTTDSLHKNHCTTELWLETDTVINLLTLSCLLLLRLFSRSNEVNCLRPVLYGLIKRKLYSASLSFLLELLLLLDELFYTIKILCGGLCPAVVTMCWKNHDLEVSLALYRKTLFQK